jgi:MobA/MobL family
MAIYYSRTSTISRAKGHSVVSAAAYRSASNLRDERTQLAHDYSKKKGVLAAEMLAPVDAPWAMDPKAAWNRAEAVEVRCNARTGREIVVALPAELTDAENIALAKTLGQHLVDRYHVVVLVAVHAPDARSDERNVHTHLLMSTRVAEVRGYGAKVRVLDDRTTGPIEAEATRVRFAELINKALRQAGHEVAVDPRPLREQARDAADRGDFEGVIALTRTPQKHQGRDATALARAGRKAGVVEANAAVRSDNRDVQVWGTERAAVLKRVAAIRAQRWVRQGAGVGAGRRQRLRNGIGPINATTTAAGADRQLLNAQAKVAEGSARAARDAAEAYLDALRRDSERYDGVLRTSFANVEPFPSMRPTDPDNNDKIEAKSKHTRSRIKGAPETPQKASATYGHGARDAARMYPMSRRKWAEHRRQQRAQREHVVDGLSEILASQFDAETETVRVRARARPAPR